MKDNTDQRILIFTTSTEKNGTAKLRDTVAEEIPDQFTAIRSYTGFLLTLLFRRNKIKAVFALSNIHFVLALYFTRKLRIRVPVVLGMYHPNQWKIYLSDRVSRTRSRIFKNLVGQLTHDSIIHSSKEGVEATNRYCGITTGTPTILQGPAEILPFVKEIIPGQEEIRIVTIGRLVDFKTCTIISMIDAIEKLVLDRGMRITYDIYGNGPSQNKLAERIQNSPINDKITLHSFVPKEEYLSTVIRYDLFYGMAGALILAASAGVPSLVAIQEEESGVSYGFISDYDQEQNPIFGDRSKFAVERPLEESILYYSRLTDDEKRILSRNCSHATSSYSTESTKLRLVQKINAAPRINVNGLSLFDFFRMFWEIRQSNARGITDEHT